uniref:Uncharacterized protein n=1 Tax=Meloidogyne enterolobii TaxID=390850 RepID=A0A6V7XI79_MELEN|nr:unnamed protein product [Meloidogyne enterolobii]
MATEEMEMEGMVIVVVDGAVAMEAEMKITVARIAFIKHYLSFVNLLLKYHPLVDKTNLYGKGILKISNHRVLIVG